METQVLNPQNSDLTKLETSVPHKPKSPYPPIIKRIARRVFPNSFYRQNFGRHEDGSNHLWRQITASLGPDQVVFDIGAFEGDYSFMARNSNPNIQIYAFEPNPVSTQRLRVTFNQQNIKLIECAVAEHDSRVTLTLESARSRMVEKRTTQSLKDVVEVSGIALDSWTNEKNVVPSLIKIDTEGAEAGIFRGGYKMIKEVEPIILCEILSDEAGKDVMNALPSSYQYYHIDENSGSFTVKSTITRKKWRNHNWLLVPLAKESKLIQILTS